jgi:biotin carboxyl carrier protein
VKERSRAQNVGEVERWKNENKIVSAFTGKISEISKSKN